MAVDQSGGPALGDGIAGANGSAIHMAGLTKRYGQFTAVDGVDLDVAVGELFSLLGPNGAGKTTTIKMLSCLLRPTAGTARILGNDVTSDPFAVKRTIAVSPQETAIAEHLTGRENLRLMAGVHGLEKARAVQRSDELLEVMALAERADEKAKKYSGGMQRRLSIAMALISDPQVLFLDEPTIGLDPQARRGMWEYISALKANTTIVLTTHYLEEADALADRIAVMDEGKIVAQGTPDELKATMDGTPVFTIEASGLTDAALQALRDRYPAVRRTDTGVEIENAEVDIYDVTDCLRPFGVAIQSTYRHQVTLDDVFLRLTGKEMRE